MSALLLMLNLICGVIIIIIITAKIDQHDAQIKEIHEIIKEKLK